MNVRVSGKQMDIGESFRERIETHIRETVGKYFDGGFSSHVIVEKTGARFSTDCKLHLDTGVVLHAAGEANDPQASFDAAAGRVDKRLRRYKHRLRDHYAGSQVVAQQGEIAYRIADQASEEEEVPEDFAPTIVAESSKPVRTMSVASAVIALDMTDEPILLFRSPGKEQLNIVYRRSDGNIGWIDSADIRD